MLLDDEETAALIQELHDIVESDRYPFSLSRTHLRCSPRSRTLRAILAELRPDPVREPLPPPKVYAPPRFIRGRRRRGLNEMRGLYFTYVVDPGATYYNMLTRD
jgi:hypothetical protein